VLFAEIAETSSRVAATRSRLAPRALLADTIGAAGADELPAVVAYLSGTLRQRRTNLGWASLPAPPPADRPSLAVLEVDASFAAIAQEGGDGSSARRIALVAALLRRATTAEQLLMRGLILGEVRQGALDSLVQDAVAAAFEVPAPRVRRAAMLLGSTASAAGLLRAGGPEALAAVTLQVGVPVRPMLAASAPDVPGALAKAGLPAVADAKLDGIRVQVHLHGARVRVFTRSLDEITDRVPGIVAAAAALPLADAVLDGEAVALGASDRPLPFQVTAARAAEHAPSIGADGEVSQLRLFCFDALRIDGVDLLDRPLADRIAVMHQRLPAELLVPRIEVTGADELTGFFDDVVGRGFEGVVVKRLDAPYAAGRRDAGWIKLKPRHTFDLAVTAAEWGYGRRTGYLSNLHLAAQDPRTGSWVMLGKTFKGLTDEMLAWQTAQIQAREARRTRSTVYADPPLVAEIACDGLQRSSRYPGGVALRFARVLRYRTDKSADEVDTIDTVRALVAEVDQEP
jgi:DNA ligase-1